MRSDPHDPLDWWYEKASDHRWNSRGKQTVSEGRGFKIRRVSRPTVNASILGIVHNMIEHTNLDMPSPS